MRSKTAPWRFIFYLTHIHWSPEMCQASQEVCNRGATALLFIEHRLSSMQLEQLGLKDGRTEWGPCWGESYSNGSTGFWEKPGGLGLCKRRMFIGFIDTHMHKCAHTHAPSLKYLVCSGSKRGWLLPKWVSERREVGSMGVGSRERLLGMHGWKCVPVGARGVRISITSFLQLAGVQPCPARTWSICCLQPLDNNRLSWHVAMRVSCWSFPFQFEGSFYLIYIFFPNLQLSFFFLFC